MYIPGFISIGSESIDSVGLASDNYICSLSMKLGLLIRETYYEYECWEGVGKVLDTKVPIKTRLVLQQVYSLPSTARETW